MILRRQQESDALTKPGKCGEKHSEGQYIMIIIVFHLYHPSKLNIIYSKIFQKTKEEGLLKI